MASILDIHAGLNITSGTSKWFLAFTILSND